MKIFLGNSPWGKEGYKGIRAGSRWPHFEHCSSPYMPFPFFLAYATALLEKNGFDVLLVDGIAEGISEDEYFRRMADFKPEIVVHEVATASIKTDLCHGERVKKVLPGAKLVFCGAHHGMFEPGFLENTPFVDFVLEGEFEFTLLELARTLAAGGPCESVKGLIFRGAEGVVKTGRRELIPLDELPWPSRKHLPMHKYWDNPGGIPAPSLQLHASRGCPFTCVFCVWPQIMYGGNKYRTRSAKDIVDEIEYCVKEYGFKSFYFDDDTFNIGKKRILELCDELINRGINLPWGAMARADTADREMLEKMKAAGLVAIKYGVESADQGILNDSGKRLDIEKAKACINDTTSLGIKCHLTFCFGLQGETRETVEKTLGFIEEVDPDTVQFSIVTPFPGSKLYNDMKAKGYLLSDDFEEYDGGNRAVIRTEALAPRDLEEALRRATVLWDKKTLKRRIWRNKFFYIKEAFKHPVEAIKALERIIG